MKNLICMFMIVMTVTIWFKYDTGFSRRSIDVDKVSIEAGSGVYFCWDSKLCGKWDGYIPELHYIMIERPKPVKPEKKYQKEESKY